ncbi:MAG: glycoside hydrolase family 95 protein [Eubacteriales bacterium]
MKIISGKPAGKWGGAFPIGNGHIGGMVYSGIAGDRIDLSENTFFSGEKSLENNRNNASRAFYEMRRQVLGNDFEGALHSSENFTGLRHNYGTNLPVGAFHVDYGHDSSKAQDYIRTLNIMDGVVKTDYIYENVTFSRTVFASHPHKIMVYRVCAGRPVLNLTAKFTGSGPSYGVSGYETGLDFFADAHESMHSDGKTGVHLCGNITVITDGQVEISDVIHVRNAAEAVFLIGMSTNFKEIKTPDEILRDLHKNAESCREYGWEPIRDQHIADFTRYMGRVDLQVRSINYSGKAVDDIPLMFQYGRYLLLSSSREDSKLPAHLQGIWNDNVACRIGWTCDMHLDINTQMNYWPGEVTNLPETTQSLFRWIEEDLVPSGRISARESYGLPGWSAEIVSNAWGYSAPYWSAPISPCPTGGVWILTHMWEHYLSTRDVSFLKERVYGLLEEAAAFFAGYVFEDPGTGLLTCGPSISPENGFVINGKTYYSSNGCTYEILMIRELFSIYLEASGILGVENELVRKAAEAVGRLIPYRIEHDGKLAEWSHDYPSMDLQHRHTSHLLGLFPFSQITPEKTPALARAAQASINEKLTPPENWEDTGWARSLLILYAARLHDGQAAFKHIESMLEHLLEENHMIIHPPTRGAGSFDNVYELDGNTGITSGIAEMLLQSYDGVLQLLPALPAEWESGEVKGLIARGGIEVNLYWDNGKLTSAEFLSRENTTCTVIYGNERKNIVLKGGEKNGFK